MTKQYNVNIVGNLTNDNGVLSGFSLNDYATLPETLENLTINSLEIVFKFKLTDNSGEKMLFCTDSTSEPVVGGLRLYSDNTSYSYGLEVTHNGGQVGYIESEGNLLSLDTYYYVKVTYSNSSGYGLYRSEDGAAYTLIGTILNTTMPSNPLGLIGTYSPWNSSLHGAIDLNESYIKVNGAMWWRGVENITKIQLRHDTAANWTSVNPVLLEGEVGIETDTRKQKFGDGVTAWNNLPYDKGSTALQSITSSNVTTALGYTPVNKAGDTMTGSLTINDNSLFIKHPIARDGSNPASGSWKAINFTDSSSPQKRFALIESSVITSGSSTLALYAYKNQSANSNNSFLIGWDNSGNKYAELNSKLLVGGVLTVEGNAIQQTIKNNINYSTYTTAGEIYSDLQFLNYADSRFNTIRSAITYDNTGTANGSYMIFGSNKLNSNAPDGIRITCDSNNNLSCTFPKTTCCDGQWVYSYSFLTNSVATTKTTISLSSYLPNDNYKYEVMGVFGRDNVNSADNYLVSSDLFNPQFNTTSGQFCVSFVTGAYARANNTSFILPVGAGRCLYTIGSNANTGNMYLYVLGYRRIGTNA